MESRVERFKYIYGKYGTYSLKYIYATMNYSRFQDAEDIHQEVFMCLFQNDIVMAIDEESIKAWILTVSKYKTYNFLKKHSTSHELLILDDFLHNNLADQSMIDTFIEFHALLPWINKLKELERRLIYDRILGLSFDEIAKQEHKSIHALKGVYYRGLKKLRKNMNRLIYT